MDKKEATVLTDNAIKTIKEDDFGFAEQAGRLARLVAGKNSPENIAVGISGSWGSGKSSMLNLIKCYLKKEEHYLEIFRQDYPEGTEDKEITKKMPIVVEFDPWFFGSEEKIIEAFFLRLAKSIYKDKSIEETLRKGIGTGLLWLSRFTKAVSGVVQIVSAGIAKPVTDGIVQIADVSQDISDDMLKEEKKDFFELKEDLEESLEKLDKKIVILIDDMDRLQADEILTMLKVIRLVTDLPKINTIIAFDHEVTAKIINEKVGGDGMGYMQKMVNVPTYLPKITHSLIISFLINKIAIILEKANNGTLEHFLYAHDAEKITHSFSASISSIREAKNILNLFALSYSTLGNKITNNRDMFSLCCLFYYYPKIFRCFSDLVFPFTVDGETEIISVREINQEMKERMSENFGVPKESKLYIYLNELSKENTRTSFVHNISSEEQYKSITQLYNHQIYFGFFKVIERTHMVRMDED